MTAILPAATSEKPGPEQATRLLHSHGPGRLRLLEGRFRLPADLLTQVHASHGLPHRGEPRLSLTLAAYARTRPVHVVTTTAAVPRSHR